MENTNKIQFKSLFPILLIFVFITGCGTIRLDTNSTTFQIVTERVPHLKPDQTVKINNYYNKAEIVMLSSNIDADLQQYTQTAIRLLTQGLAHRSINVEATGKKSIKLRVHNVKIIRAFFTLQVELNTTATLGNGQSFTVFHHNSSPSTGFRAASGAIARSIEKVIKHDKFLDYINN